MWQWRSGGKNMMLKAQSLWDPWGVFFIYLTYEIGISDYKGMNSKWIFIYLFLSIKKDDISRYVFHIFAGCEFTAKNGWILRHVFHMFAGCEFTAKNGWILKYVFHMFMWVWIYSKEWLNFKACFSYVCRVWIYGKEWWCTIPVCVTSASHTVTQPKTWDMQILIHNTDWQLI